MRVLVVSNLYPPDVMGGYELGCRQAVDALIARGHEVRVLTTIPRKPAPGVPHVRRTLRLTDIWDSYQFRHAAPVSAHLGQHESHRINAANVHALLAEIDEFRPDVAYPWMLAGVGGLGLMAAIQHKGIPWCWHLMDDVPKLLCMAAGRLVPSLARSLGRDLAGRFLACSRQLVDEVEAAGIRLPGPVEVVPNWVEHVDGPVRQSYLQDGILRICTAAGRLERKADKGIDLLIEAAALMRSVGRENFVVDIFGPPIDGDFEAMIRALDLTRHVRLMGPRLQAELSTLYADYDLFAFPTRPREPFGFAPLEAAAAGCVPVATQACGLSEWLVHGVHLLKAPRTTAAFASTFVDVMTSRIDIASIGRRVAKVVRRDFSLDAILPRIESALSAAADEGIRPRGSSADAYRLAMLAEKLTRVMVPASLSA